MPEKLASLLLAEGVVPLEAVARARARQRDAGGTLDSALLELGVPEDRLTEALARTSGLPAAPEIAFVAPDARARRVFPAKVAERHGVAPFALEGRELSIAVCQPIDPGLLDEIGFMLSLDLKPHVATEWRVRDLIHRLYGTPMPERLAQLASGAAASRGGAAAAEPAPPPPPYAEGPAVGAPVKAPAGEAAVVAPEPKVDADASTGSPPEPAEGAPRPSDIGSPRPGFGAVPFGAVPDIASAQRARPMALAVYPPPALAGRLQPANSELGEPLAAALAQALEAAEAKLLSDPPADAPAVDDPARAQPPRWSFAEARRALAAARSRDDIVAVALRYARDFFEFAALFAITRDRVVGHDALAADPGARARARSMSVPGGEAGMFRAVVDTGGPYLGPIARELGNGAVLAALGRTPRTALLYPVLLRDRVVCILYADNGEAPVSARRVGDFLLLASALGASFERVLRERKRGQAVPEEAWRATEPARADLDFPLEVDIDLGDYEVVPVGAAGAAPFDPEAAADRLAATAPGSSERGSLIASLVQHGARTAAVLAARLPGPIDPGTDGAPIYDRGPLLAAVAALGGAATRSLVAVLGDPDPERRRIAVRLLGAIGDPAAFGALAERLFDGVPAVAADARAALALARRHPELGTHVEKLRHALLSGIAERSVRAAQALGELRDAESIPLLIQVLEAEGAPAIAAAQALSDITLQTLGRSPRRWLAWWKQNRSTPRARWLLSALMHANREVRAAAAKELGALAHPPVPYSPDASAPEREKATRAWTALWAHSRFEA